MALFFYPAQGVTITGGATEAKQDTIITELQAVNTELDAVNADKATATKQDTGNASLSSIDGKVATETTLSTISSNVATAAKQDTGNASLASIDSKDFATQTTLAAQASDIASLEGKTASAAVTEAFDYQDITYVGATTRVDTITYKTGGAAGTTVATVTMAYDGSDRLISVTKV